MKRPEEIQAYPLCWPEGWQRTPPHVRDDGSRFKTGNGYEWRFRTLAKRRHPDADGGSVELMAELNEAREDAAREFGVQP